MEKSQERIAFARELRQKQTDAERVLWARLRNEQLEGAKFRRQQSVGKCIVDFVSFGNKLVIEIDGGQHNEGKMKQRDIVRTKDLEASGYRVLRFWNNDVLTNMDGVLERVMEALG